MMHRVLINNLSEPDVEGVVDENCLPVSGEIDLSHIADEEDAEEFYRKMERDPEFLLTAPMTEDF